MEQVNREALEKWMDGRRLGASPISDPYFLAGGTQNILLRFARGDEQFVLRRPPAIPRPNSNEAMRREARILAALRNTAVPHPRFIAGCDDEAVLGAAFYLMAPVDGFNATGGLPDLHAGNAAMRKRIGLSMVEAIAALGHVDHHALGLSDFGNSAGFLDRHVGRWRNQLASYEEMAGWPGPATIPGVDAVAQWLEDNRPSNFQPGVMHGDFHLANVMVRPDSGEIAAIVDWELSTIGDPLLDLGWLLATWPEGEIPKVSDVAAEPWTGFATPGEIAAHYASVSGRDLSSLNWYVVLACFKLGIISRGVMRGPAPERPRLKRGAAFTHIVSTFSTARCAV